MGRKRTPRSVKRSCDRLFSELIRTKRRCEKCGERNYALLQAAHIYSRKFGSIRYDKDNAFCLCASCHRYFHDNPVELHEFVKKTKGEKRLSELKKRKVKITRRNLHDWLELEQQLKDEIKELEESGKS